MANVDTLVSAGLIANASQISSQDQDTINKLTTDEINALISVYNAVGLGFLSRNCGSSSPAASPTTHPLGIVF
jgi:hypothetical protein